MVLGGNAHNESAIRHELYHIADGHCDTPAGNLYIDTLKYVFWYEPQATIYEITRLKL